MFYLDQPIPRVLSQYLYLLIRGFADWLPLSRPGPSTGTTVSSTPATTTSSNSTPATTAAAATAGGSSGGTAAGGLGDLPEGVDPSFLAALPENIRQEVMCSTLVQKSLPGNLFYFTQCCACERQLLCSMTIFTLYLPYCVVVMNGGVLQVIGEQLRLQRIQQRAQEQQQQAAQLGASEVSPEFLAALPPAIQEEVLAQQRAEQARMEAERTPSTAAPPESQVDPAGFIASLPPSLRQQVSLCIDLFF